MCSFVKDACCMYLYAVIRKAQQLLRQDAAHTVCSRIPMPRQICVHSPGRSNHVAGWLVPLAQDASENVTSRIAGSWRSDSKKEGHDRVDVDEFLFANIDYAPRFVPMSCPRGILRHCAQVAVGLSKGKKLRNIEPALPITFSAQHMY